MNKRAFIEGYMSKEAGGKGSLVASLFEKLTDRVAQPLMPAIQRSQTAKLARPLRYGSEDTPPLFRGVYYSPDEHESMDFERLKLLLRNRRLKQSAEVPIPPDARLSLRNREQTAKAIGDMSSQAVEQMIAPALSQVYARAAVQRRRREKIQAFLRRVGEGLWTLPASVGGRSTINP